MAIDTPEFRPRPGKDPIDDAIKCGWRYMDDISDPLAGITNFYSPAERTPERAQIRRREEALASYVIGVGIVYDAARDKNGVWMVLPDDSKGVFLNRSNR